MALGILSTFDCKMNTIPLCIRLPSEDIDDQFFVESTFVRAS
jgi:hypothetical protein